MSNESTRPEVGHKWSGYCNICQQFREMIVVDYGNGQWDTYWDVVSRCSKCDNKQQNNFEGDR